MVPEVGATNPEIELNRVVFPAPFGPIKPTIEFGSIVRKTSSRARKPPNSTVRLEIESKEFELTSSPTLSRAN